MTRNEAMVIAREARARAEHDNQDTMAWMRWAAIRESCFRLVAPHAEDDGRPVFETLQFSPARRSGRKTAIDFVARSTEAAATGSRPVPMDLKMYERPFMRIAEVTARWPARVSASPAAQIFRDNGLPLPRLAKNTPDEYGCVALNVSDYVKLDALLSGRASPAARTRFMGDLTHNDVRLALWVHWRAGDYGSCPSPEEQLRSLFICRFSDIRPVIIEEPMVHFYKNRNDTSDPLGKFISLWSRGGDSNCSYYFDVRKVPGRRISLPIPGRIDMVWADAVAYACDHGLLSPSGKSL